MPTNTKTMPTGWGWGLVVGLIIIILFGVSAVAIVPAGYRGVKLQWGASTNITFDEGIHLVTPLMQSVVNLNVRTQLFSASAEAASRDLQNVTTNIGLNFYVDPSQVTKVYDKYGTYYAQSLIAPILQETVKSVTASYTAEELITERPLVQAAIQAKLSSELGKYNLIVQQVSITNFEFSPDFQLAIEQKVTAQQNLLKQGVLLNMTRVIANQTVALAVGNATAMIIRANGTARSAQIIQDALAGNPKYLQYIIATEWNGKLPMVVSGSGSSLLPVLNLNLTTNLTT